MSVFRIRFGAIDVRLVVASSYREAEEKFRHWEKSCNRFEEVITSIEALPEKLIHEGC